MSLESLDHELVRWKGLLTNTGNSLVELDSSPTYQGIRSRAFQGRTEAQIRPVRLAIDRLWNCYGQVCDVIARVEGLRAHPPAPWKREEWMREMQALLHGPVIADAVPGDPSLAGDAMAPPVAPTLSIADALEVVLDSATQTRTMISKLDARFSEIEERVRALNAQVSPFSQIPGSEALLTMIGHAREVAERDPLGGWSDEFVAARHRIEKLASDASALMSVRTRLASAKERLHEFDRAVAGAQAASDRCRVAFGEAVAAPTVGTDDLESWLATLSGMLGKSEPATISVGFSRWSSELDARLEAVNATRRANEARIARFEEIRGRLGVARARARARGTDPTTVAAKSEEIERLLAARPVQLDPAERLVSQLEGFVRG